MAQYRSGRTSYQVRFYGSLGSLNVSFWRQSGLRKSEKLRRIKDHSNSVSSFPGALTKLRYPPERYGFVVPALPVATSNVRFGFFFVFLVGHLAKRRNTIYGKNPNTQKAVAGGQMHVQSRPQGQAVLCGRVPITFIVPLHPGQDQSH